MFLTSSGVGANGFSHITCFPPSSPPIESGAWYIFGVQTSIISISGSEKSSEGSVVSLVTLCSLPQLLRTSSRISQPATISAFSEAFQPGIWVFEIPPTPIIATFKILDTASLL